MARPSFDDLMATPSQDDVLQQEVIPELKKRGSRVTDWIVGGCYMVMAFVVALLRASVRVAIATLTAAGFEDYVFGRATPPPDSDGVIPDVTGWAPLVARERYGLLQIEATYTRRSITLTNTSNTAYGPLQPGDMIIQFPSGNQYVLDQVVTIPAAVGLTPSSIQATFRSYFATNTAAGIVYNDGTDQAISLVIANFPGVTATNPAPTYSPVAHAGTGLGLVTPSGVPSSSPHSVAVRIVTEGNAGASAGWQYLLDIGTWSATQTVASLMIGDNITVTLTDNGGNPAFFLDEVYYFNTPGSDITQIGTDIEAPQDLGARVVGLWPALSFPQDENGRWIPTSPTQSGYEALVRSANKAVRVVLIANGTVNNELFVVIAGVGGAPLSPADVANVQQFLDAYSMETDLPLVLTSTPRLITLAGLTIYCKAALLAAAQSALTRRLQLYFGGSDPGAPLNINGRVDYDYLISLIRTTPGVTRVAGTLTINSSAGDLQLPVIPGAYEAARWKQAITDAFGWQQAA